MEWNWLEPITSNPRDMSKLSYQTRILYSNIAQNTRTVYWGKKYWVVVLVTTKHTKGCMVVGARIVGRYSRARLTGVQDQLQPSLLAIHC